MRRAAGTLAVPCCQRAVCPDDCAEGCSLALPMLAVACGPVQMLAGKSSETCRHPSLSRSLSVSLSFSFSHTHTYTHTHTHTRARARTHTHTHARRRRDARARAPSFLPPHPTPHHARQPHTTPHHARQPHTPPHHARRPRAAADQYAYPLNRYSGLDMNANLTNKQYVARRARSPRAFGLPSLPPLRRPNLLPSRRPAHCLPLPLPFPLWGPSMLQSRCVSRIPLAGGWLRSLLGCIACRAQAPASAPIANLTGVCITCCRPPRSWHRALYIQDTCKTSRPLPSGGSTRSRCEAEREQSVTKTIQSSGFLSQMLPFSFREVYQACTR